MQFSLTAQVLDSLIEGPSVQAPQNSTVPVTINCPAGYTAVSGGWERAGGSGELFVPRSYPSSSTLNGWDFEFRNPGASTSTVNTFLVVRRIIITAIDDNIGYKPSQFSLGQNYPNPFNPTTILKYEISKSSNVKLTIYNVLGQIVKTLVNEEKSPGKYSVSFNAESLSSGIYFYTIKAGDFVKTKKMVLLK